VITFADILDQTAALEALRGAYLSNRLPHGLVFAGPAGVGKGTTAAALAGLFLCERPDTTNPCGACEGCRVFDAGNHPDYHVVYRQLARLEKPKAVARDVSVDVIRAFLVEPASRKSVMGRGKVFVIEEAETMSPAAQNALLKTLEEPAGRALIVLITENANALLPTIRSRCQVVRFASLSPELVRRELEKRGISKTDAADAATLTNGSLGVALRWLEDGVVAQARDLVRHVDALVASGHAPVDLEDWFKRAADAYAAKQIERDELTSKDQATREGLSLYLGIAANRFRAALASAAADDAEQLERTCAAIDAIVAAETNLDANVNVALTFQQLAVALGREFARAR
jgi:DNA polymerase III delta' subunit